MDECDSDVPGEASPGRAGKGRGLRQTKVTDMFPNKKARQRRGDAARADGVQGDKKRKPDAAGPGKKPPRKEVPEDDSEASPRVNAGARLYTHTHTLSLSLSLSLSLWLGPHDPYARALMASACPAPRLAHCNCGTQRQISIARRSAKKEIRTK